MDGSGSTQPKNTFKKRQIEAPNADQYMQEDTTVAHQLKGLLDDENPYIKMARSSAQQWANERGLLNSSMAAGAGQAAAIKAALPIAQQDASTAKDFRGRQQVTESQASLNDQQAGYAWDQTAFQGAVQEAIVGKQGQINKMLNEQQNKFKAELNSQNLTAAARANYAQQYTSLSQTLATNIEYILRDEKLGEDAKTNAIMVLRSRFEADTTHLASLVGIDLSWE